MNRVELKATVYVDDGLIEAYDDDGIGFDPERLGVDYGWEELQHVALEVTHVAHVEDGATPFPPKLGIIGRERALIDKLAKLLADSAGGYHERTDPRHTDRGAEFEVRIFEGKRRDEPTGRIARVTVELDRVEP